MTGAGNGCTESRRYHDKQCDPDLHLCLSGGPSQLPQHTAAVSKCRVASMLLHATLIREPCEDNTTAMPCPRTYHAMTVCLPRDGPRNHHTTTRRLPCDIHILPHNFHATSVQ